MNSVEFKHSARYLEHSKVPNKCLLLQFDVSFPLLMVSPKLIERKTKGRRSSGLRTLR